MTKFTIGVNTINKTKAQINRQSDKRTFICNKEFQRSWYEFDNILVRIHDSKQIVWNCYSNHHAMLKVEYNKAK